ncbi:hypothetical protein B7486_78480, partial [cyanobacterium TDX16]
MSAEAAEPQPSEALPEAEASRTGFWVAVVVGSLVAAWGIWLFVQATTPSELLALVAAVVVSDLLVDWLALPVVVLAGWLVS